MIKFYRISILVLLLYMNLGHVPTSFVVTIYIMGSIAAIIAD